MVKWDWPEEKQPQRPQADSRLAEALQQVADLRRQMQEMQTRASMSDGDAKYALDNLGMKRTWQVGGEGNVDIDGPLTTVLFIPPATKQIERVFLWLKLKEFEAYSAVFTVTTPSTRPSGGARWSTGSPDPDQPSVDEHTHTISVPDHTHDTLYAIIHTGMVGGVGVIINGVNVTTALGGPFNEDQTSLDITQYVQAIGANDIQFTCTSERGRIQWGAFVELYLP